MMAENHPAIRRYEIFSVILHDGRRRALIIEHENFRRDPFAIEPVADRRCAKSRGHDPKRANLFAPRKCQHAERSQANQRHRNPKQFFPKTHRRLNLPKLFNLAKLHWEPGSSVAAVYDRRINSSDAHRATLQTLSRLFQLCQLFREVFLSLPIQLDHISWSAIDE